MSQRVYLYQQRGLLEKFYDACVRPLERKFQRYALSQNSTAICPLHDDNDPSLGVISQKGGFSYHCFGCGAWGDIVDLCRNVEARYAGKTLSEQAAINRVIELLGLELPENYEDVRETASSRMHQRRAAMAAASRRYSVSDWERAVLSLRRTNPKQLDSHLLRLMDATRVLEAADVS